MFKSPVKKIGEVNLHLADVISNTGASPQAQKFNALPGRAQYLPDTHCVSSSGWVLG